MSKEKKGNWTKEEDEKLLKEIQLHGASKWSTIAEYLGMNRNGKQCRERWFNHLNPNIKKGWWTPEEEKIIIETHNAFGNCWSKISKQLPGRPANLIKNHYNSTLKRIVAEKKKEILKSVTSLPITTNATIELPVYSCIRNRKKEAAGEKRMKKTISIQVNLHFDSYDIQTPRKRNRKRKRNQGFESEIDSTSTTPEKKRRIFCFTKAKNFSLTVINTLNLTPRKYSTRSQNKIPNISILNDNSVVEKDQKVVKIEEKYKGKMMKKHFMNYFRITMNSLNTINK